MNKFPRKYIGSLFTIAAASGSGKTSLVKSLADTVERLQVSISHTTRSPRAGEQDGVHYFFVQRQQFLNLISMNEFIEHAEVFGHYYGTSRTWVDETLNKGIDVVLEIDWQGAAQIRKQFPDSTSIFILPPSMRALRQRLIKRQQDSLDSIEQRLAAANEEISHYDEFDYLVINEDFQHALLDLKSIIKAKRLECSLQIKKHSKLLEDLVQYQLK